MLLRSTFVIAITLLSLTASAQSPADHFENVRVKLVNGSSIRATIDVVDGAGIITGSSIVNDIALDQIIEIVTGRKIQAERQNGTVHLRSLTPNESDRLKTGEGQTSAGSISSRDGRIPFSSVQIDGDRLKINGGERKWELPLETVQAIVWNDGPAIDSEIAEPSAGEDSVVVRTSSGQRVVRGLVESLDGSHVNIFYDGETRKISLEKVQAVVPAKIEIDTPTGTLASIQLIDGSMIDGAIRMYGENGEPILKVAIGGNHELDIEAEFISSIAIQSNRIAWLSDLTPIRVEQQSQFAAARPWQRDRSLLGNSIRLKFHNGNRTHDFEKGIGTRSYTSLVYSNSKKFTEFRSVVGIDAETGGHGDCEMVVQGDGIRLWGKRVRATDDPEPIVVDISGINEVALIVRPGETFDLADHADWADARFTKSD